MFSENSVIGFIISKTQENFVKVIDKAKDSCTNAGETVTDHFPDVRKTISMPKGAEKKIEGFPEIMEADQKKSQGEGFIQVFRMDSA